jgi:hypothetical protein
LLGCLLLQGWEHQFTRSLVSFLNDWSLDEDRKRVAHALTIAEKLVEPTVYEKACDVGLIVIEASRGRGHTWRSPGRPPLSAMA